MTSSENDSNPSVSVVIPVYADPEGLRTTLESFVSQSYSELEIIVAVTPSSGKTLEVATEFQTEFQDLVQVVEVRESGRAKARNAGIAISQGDIIAFIDADIWLDKDWLNCAVSNLQISDVEYLACSVDISSAKQNMGFVGRYDQALSIPVGHYVEDYQFAPTAALLVTRDLLEDVDNFDPELISGEDREFGNRVYSKGYELAVSDCAVYHPPRTKISEQVQKAIRIGRGMEQLGERYPSRYSNPSLLSPLSYAPPDPRRFNSRLSTNDYDASLVEWVLFYLFNYILKLFQQIGRWKQHVAD